MVAELCESSLCSSRAMKVLHASAVIGASFSTVLCVRLVQIMMRLLGAGAE